MTVTTTYSGEFAFGDGATTTFTYDFPIPGSTPTDQTNVLISIIDGISGVTTVITDDLYSITGVGSSGGGTYTYPLGGGTPLGGGSFITIQRVAPAVQNTSLPNQSLFYGTSVEKQLDYLTMLVQQIITTTAGTLRFPEGEFFYADFISSVLPPVEQRLNSTLYFDGTGTPQAGQPIGVPVSAVMQPVVAAATLSAAVTALFASGGSSGGNFTPVTDNAVSLGISGKRWSSVWAANGTIQTSDPSLKVDIEQIKAMKVSALDLIAAIDPITFRWKVGGIEAVPVAVPAGIVDTGDLDPTKSHPLTGKVGAWDRTAKTVERPGKRLHWGFDAAQIGAVFEAAGVDFGGYVVDDAGVQHIRPDQFIPIVWRAMQQQQDEIGSLKDRMSAMEHRFDAMMAAFGAGAKAAP